MAEPLFKKLHKYQKNNRVTFGRGAVIFLLKFFIIDMKSMGLFLISAIVWFGITPLEVKFKIFVSTNHLACQNNFFLF